MSEQYITLHKLATDAKRMHNKLKVIVVYFDQAYQSSAFDRYNILFLKIAAHVDGKWVDLTEHFKDKKYISVAQSVGRKALSEGLKKLLVDPDEKLNNNYSYYECKVYDVKGKEDLHQKLKDEYERLHKQEKNVRKEFDTYFIENDVDL